MLTVQEEILSDEELALRFQAAQAESEAHAHAGELFGRYKRRVATWCYRYAGDRETALDLAQDVFLKAYQNLNSFRVDSKFSTWLYIIMRNNCLNYVRQRSGEPLDSSEPILVIEPPDSRSWDTSAVLEREARLRDMRTLMQEALDETESRVMVMHYSDELPLETITRLLGLTNASGAKALIVSAKRKLQTAVRRMQARQLRPRPAQLQGEGR
ncbi:MAG TPA: sigma-70 family RNA polymerase sigma factor [Paludibaculum sp.]|jgi:RNA polymerase sigma-70 factor (ECF subfamily)